MFGAALRAETRTAISACFVMWGLVRWWRPEGACATSSLVPTTLALGSCKDPLVTWPSATAGQDGQHKAKTSALKGPPLPKPPSTEGN